MESATVNVMFGIDVSSNSLKNNSRVEHVTKRCIHKKQVTRNLPLEVWDLIIKAYLAAVLHPNMQHNGIIRCFTALAPIRGVCHAFYALAQNIMRHKIPSSTFSDAFGDRERTIMRATLTPHRLCLFIGAYVPSLTRAQMMLRLIDSIAQLEITMDAVVRFLLLNLSPNDVKYLLDALPDILVPQRVLKHISAVSAFVLQVILGHIFDTHSITEITQLNVRTASDARVFISSAINLRLIDITNHACMTYLVENFEQGLLQDAIIAHLPPDITRIRISTEHGAHRFNEMFRNVIRHMPPALPGGHRFVISPMMKYLCHPVRTSTDWEQIHEVIRSSSIDTPASQKCTMSRLRAAFEFVWDDDDDIRRVLCSPHESAMSDVSLVVTPSITKLLDDAFCEDPTVPEVLIGTLHILRQFINETYEQRAFTSTDDNLYKIHDVLRNFKQQNPTANVDLCRRCAHPKIPSFHI
jgi:hypothetical protein